MLKTKTCTHCGRLLLLNSDNFPKNKRTKDQFGSWCRSCTRDSTRASMRKSRIKQAATAEFK